MSETRYLVVLLLLLLQLDIRCQKIVPGNFLETIDKLADSTTIGFYSSIEDNVETFSLLDLTTRLSYNSTYPRGFNDGAVWKGKGATFEMHGGVAGKKGKFTFQFMPVLYFSQNSDFELASRINNGLNPLAYQFTGGIDWVQKFGNKSGFYFHPGQSEIKFKSSKFVSSISTQNHSFGPSTFNPILLSHQGGGFPHLRIGAEPFSLGEKIGDFEVNFLVGLLAESGYYDDNPENDTRYLNGLFFGFSPAFLPNLKVGLGKVLYKQTRYFAPEDLISAIYVLEDTNREGLSTGNDTFDQLASVYIDWSFPEVAFRAYAEFAKNDFTGRSRGTIVEPEHTRGYTIGFEKRLLSAKNKEVTLLYEHTNLSRNQAFLWRATPSFYSHGVNRQGYTNNGQLIGAGIGPGGNSDHLFIKVQNESENSFAFLIQRIENNRDYFVINTSGSNRDLDEGDHDIEYTLGFSFSKQFRTIQFITEISASHNYSRYYEDDATNLAIMIGTRIDL